MIRYRHRVNPKITATMHVGIDCFQVLVTLSGGFGSRMHIDTFRRYYAVDLNKGDNP